MFNLNQLNLTLQTMIFGQMVPVLLVLLFRIEILKLEKLFVYQFQDQ